ncbi:chymotrypsin-2-like [Lutzomyia longipalpis]|uniref:Putative chymotrypsin-2-like protein n=1 Tax=Lutzomyia longipalpis TaxID=7200 RepID=A0A1B0CNV4_LUTLO|nr:chymotrypsin-2-like [Lutzomyia longipalpis]
MRMRYQWSFFVFTALLALTVARSVPEEYREPNTGYIVGGSNAARGQFPYQVSLRTLPGIHFCGGAIVGSRWILTAGLCLSRRTPTSVNAFVGSHLLSDSTRYLLSDLVVHPQFNENTMLNDVGLARTQEAIVYSALIQPIALGSSYIGGSVIAIATGWGRITENGPTPNNLQWVNLGTLTNDDCKNRLPPPHVGLIFDSTLCTFTRTDEGVCYGDTGGPLNSGNVVIGIVSWGVRCAISYPDVFTRVSSHRTWIMENITD